MSDIETIPVKRIDGTPATLGDHHGQVRLVVNVASKCGLTPQYEALEAVQQRFADSGFTVLGFPCNDFAGQEPGTPEEIVEFCSTNYSVTFPLFDKISVVGPDQHPLYRELTHSIPAAAGDPGAFRERLRGFGMTPNEEPDILWNFEKFLVNKEGEVVARFAPTMTPDDPAVIAAIESALS